MNKLICLIKGHDIHVVDLSFPHIKRYFAKCSRCKQYLGIGLIKNK